MATHNLDRGFGLGQFKVIEDNVSLSSGDTITADGLSNISSVILTAEATSGNYVVANFSISDNVVTVLLAGAASGTAPSTLTSAVTVHYIIIGQ